MRSITSYNMVHAHLLLNHVPTVGAVVALGLLILAFVRRDESLKRTGLELVFLIALLTLPAYMTGVAAHEQILHTSWVSDAAVRAHQDAALYGFAVTEFAGFIAWVALWQTRRRGRATAGLVPATLVLSIIAVGFMARAATLGGDIRHPEMQSAPAAAAEAATVGVKVDPLQYVQGRVSNIMVYSYWAWPASETVHFLGLSLTFGVLLLVNLRILGAMKHVPYADVHRLLPWGMLGFGSIMITGMLFVLGQPGQYYGSPPFYWKIVFLVVAGADYLYLTVSKQGWAAAGSESAAEWNFRGLDKFVAVAAMITWLAILYCGRMLPFLGKSF